MTTNVFMNRNKLLNSRQRIYDIDKYKLLYKKRNWFFLFTGKPGVKGPKGERGLPGMLTCLIWNNKLVIYLFFSKLLIGSPGLDGRDGIPGICIFIVIHQ